MMHEVTTWHYSVCYATECQDDLVFTLTKWLCDGPRDDHSGGVFIKNQVTCPTCRMILTGGTGYGMLKVQK